jgi:Curli production assembly/transport component CsgG
MPSQALHALFRRSLVLGPAAALVATAALAQPATGPRVLLVQGDARANGQPLAAGQQLAAGAALVLSTASGARMQLLMPDGSLLGLPAASEARLADGGLRQLTLARGGLRLVPAGSDAWRVELDGRSLRAVGFLQLQECAAGCTQPPGLYGRTAAGEAVLEYQGGRAVLRNRSFHWPSAKARPEIVPEARVLLDDSSSQAAAEAVRREATEALKAGIEAFAAGDDARATEQLERSARLAPGQVLGGYYLGLIALRRDDTARALTLLQQYAQADPEGAASRDVPKTLTLLSSAALRAEVAQAVATEQQVVSAPPEPGSIAVRAFLNQGDPAYRAMAKGLAALVIADLSRVPGLKVLEREKVELLVGEAKLGDSGLADRSSAVRSGRLMRAEKVVVGNFEVK